MAKRPSGYFVREYGQELAIVNTKEQTVLLVLLLALLFALPLFLSRVWLSWFTITSIYLIAALGLNITTGFAGQISIGQAAFMGVGAFTGAALTTHLHWPFLICLLCSGVIAAVAGTAFSLACFRLKGFYLALVTIAAHFFLPFAVLHLPQWTGGVFGLTLPVPSIAGIAFDTTQKWFYLVLALALITVFLTKNLQRTRIGRAFIAVRDNDRAASAVGVNVSLYKMLSFFLGAFFAGIAGYLLVSTYTNCDLTYFSILESIWLLGMLIVGGLGVVTGTIFGTVLLRLLGFATNRLAPSILNALPSFPLTAATGVTSIIYALVIVLFLIFEPRGINHLWDRFKNWYRLWPFSRTA
jgi:branched-chain amino acid transport system permease protein